MLSRRSCINKEAVVDFQNVTFELAAGRKDQLPKAGVPEIVFSGKSNVGKSSLINKLFNRKNLARVSAVPGKTATINFYGVEDVVFVDLPGYGYAKVAKSEKYRWSELIEGYFNQKRNVALVILLVDIRHEPSKLDVQMVDYLVEMEYPFIVVLTKADKLSARQKENRLKAFRGELPYGDEIHMLAVSSQTGEGIEQLRALVEDVCEE